MKRLTSALPWALALILMLTIFREGFPTIPVLYGCITAASVLFGWCCLTSKELPAGEAAQHVPENIRLRWCRVLGCLFLVNGALCPLGLLLWYALRFDQDMVLCAQIFGFLAVCFASLVPVYRARRPS